MGSISTQFHFSHINSVMLNRCGDFWLTSLKFHRHTYLFTPRSRVLLEKLTGFQPIKKFSAFYRTRKVITLSLS